MISDIHPNVTERGTFCPESFYTQITHLLAGYAKEQGYDVIAQTTNDTAISNDENTKQFVQKWCMSLPKINLARGKTFPAESDTDVSECVVLKQLRES